MDFLYYIAVIAVWFFFRNAGSGKGVKNITTEELREELKDKNKQYVWGKDVAEYTTKYKVDDRGWIHIHEFTEIEIRNLLFNKR